MQITHIIVHTPEQVTGIIDEALRIVAEAELDGDLKAVAFEKTCDLLGQRFTFAAPQPMIDASAVVAPLMSRLRNERH